ncbi:MAG TPA: FtsQ-type POTRA domain-containing protein [Candidatus Atribacteria bacterium]|nr:FtsQ-type POTRA domain-containing protein [Candidatus Atribacteria bacterium]
MFSLIFQTGIFKVKRIEISGNQWLQEEELLKVVNIPLGSNIFALRPWEIEKRLEELPQVKEARVRKSFPYLVQIEIKERQPEAWVEVGDKVFCVDEEGVEIPASSTDLVRVYLPENRKSLLLESLDLIKVWKKEFELPLSAVTVENDRLFILQLQSGIFIRCEGVNNLKKKSAILKPYLRDIAVKYLDVGGFDLRVGDDLVIVPSEEDAF